MTFSFFLKKKIQSHIPATLIIDLHGLYKAPSYLRGPIEFYIGMSRDPLVGVASGAFGDSSHLAWFKSFLLLELCVFLHLQQIQNQLMLVFQILPVTCILPGFTRIVQRYVLHLKHWHTMYPHPNRSGSRTIYPLLALYAASTATTTLACVFQILQTPETTPETQAQNLPSITASQRLLLLSSYIPFFLIPLIMAVDMGVRVHKLVKFAVKKQEEKWE